MNRWKRRLPAPAATMAALVIMAIVLSAAGHGSEVMALTLGVLLFVRALARGYADELLGSQYPRHGDSMD
jgi:hypothetical protein